jgi:hypothetical protein
MFRKIVKFAVLIALVWIVVSIARPYWHKYRIGQDIEAAAIFGTKNSVGDTRGFLARKMKEAGRSFSGDDFKIAKDERNNVTISISYFDEIRVFGLTVTELEFTIEKSKSEVKGTF